MAPRVRTQETPSRTTVEVRLLGHRLVLKGDGEHQKLQRLADYVQDKLATVQNHAANKTNGQRLALVTALNIAEDFLHLQDEFEVFRKEIIARSQAILLEIDAEPEATKVA
jgi:cell division protein ZapA (FtsZ GTPase activity inhibitor)